MRCRVYCPARIAPRPGTGASLMQPVTLSTRLAVRIGLADLPGDVRWRQIYGAGWLSGIGFTMSLFISSLAFGDGPLLDAAKVGILLASLVAGVVGWSVIGTSGSVAVGARRAVS